MSDNRLNEIIQTSLESIRSMVDSNTVIGNPITTANGTVIIPVSKVFVGFASGGIDYRDKNFGDKPVSNNFGGGGGTGLTVAPVGFLVVAPNGSVELLNVNEPTKEKQDPISQVVGLLERSPELLERLQAVFSKKEDDSSKTESASNK
jgi:sporulation protein YtfJ